MISEKYDVISITVIITLSLFNSSVRGHELYSNCGEANTICMGARKNVASFNTDGCIETENCQAFLKVTKNTETEPALFNWELAIQYNENVNSAHHFNTLYLAINKERIILTKTERMPNNIPYWYMLTRATKTHFKPYIRLCTGPDPNICSKTSKTMLNIKNISKYVKFSPLTRKSYTDSNLQYLSSVGNSLQLLTVRLEEEEFSYDLLNEQLTISLFHWYSNETGPYEKNFGGNFDPIHLFKKKGGKDDGTRDGAETDSQKGSLLWLWILLGAIGLALILIILCVICCCIKKKKRKSLKSIGNSEPTPISKSPSNTVTGRTKSKTNVNEENLVKKKSTIKNVPVNRIDYITKLAGYDNPHKPVSTKVIPARDHDFNKSFHSTSVAPK